MESRMSKSFWAAFLAALLGLAPSVWANGPCDGGKVKFYRNPMGAPDVSPAPKKDSMGMDYIPVCEDAVGPKSPAGTVAISADRVQKIGVRTEEVQERVLSRSVRAFATVQYDERRQSVVAPK